MVSMKDIALKCGVSVATVSKALNGQQDIGSDTRERIVRAAAEMGYTPNAAARMLKTNRSHNLGVLFVDEMNSGLRHEYFSAMLNSFKDEAEKLGYDITFISRSLGEPAMSYLDIVANAKEMIDVPMAAYSVSGEYAMVKAAAANGWIDEKRIVAEMAVSAYRAGVDIYITYYAREIAKMIKEGYIG